MNKSLLPFIALLSWQGFCFSNEKTEEHPKYLSDYKTYSLTSCIMNNYTQMGVDFENLNIHDYTLGFIDIEEGLALSANKNNPLDKYIKEKTENYYKPKQSEGDLATSNLVIRDCVEFYKSRELDIFLKKLLNSTTP